MLRAFSFSLMLCLMTGLQVTAQDRSTPEATIRTILSALSKADIKQAAACVKGAQTSAGFLDAIAIQVKKEPATFTLTNAKTIIVGNTAQVAGQVDLKSSNPKRPLNEQTISVEVSLELSANIWRIVPDATKAKRSDNQDVINALAYVLTDSKPFDRAHNAAVAASCLSHIKQVVLGALVLAQDSDEKFKLKAESYKKSLMPFVKGEVIFKCPADIAGGTSYAFNANLAGVSLDKITKPAETVLIYEGKNGKLDFRHDGKAAIGFADGHAKLMTLVEAKKLRWMP